MQSKIQAGERFGKLVTVSAEEGGRGAIRWHCRCDCGKEFDAYESALLSGKARSCGCMKSPDRTGQRFGLLTVMGRSDKRAPRGARTVPLWECRCDCGATVYKAMDTLTNADRCSCRACANKLNTQNSRQFAGFEGGTQLTRLVSKKPVGGNASGRRGVNLDKRTGLWRARLRLRGTTMELGFYSRRSEAIKARERAEEEYYEPLLAQSRAIG